MTYEANKYRIRPLLRNRPRQQTKRMGRLEAIKAIARLLEQGNDAFIKDFHQRTISSDHKAKLLQIADLWRNLDNLEAAIKAPRP